MDLEALLADQRVPESELPSASPVGVFGRTWNELAGERRLSELFHLIVGLAVRSVRAESGVLMTLEKDGQFKVRASTRHALEVDATLRSRVVNEHVSVLIRETPSDPSQAEEPGSIGRRIRTAMVVPLRIKDRTIGVMSVEVRASSDWLASEEPSTESEIPPQGARAFSPADLKILTIVAHVAAIQIERVQLDQARLFDAVITEDIEQAIEIHATFLPGSPPMIPGLDLAGYDAPCRAVGGDYYHFFSCQDGRLAMVLGDVSGKGVAASLLMASLHARVQVLIEELAVASIGAAMSQLNRRVASSCPANRFITFFLCVLNPITGELHYCNAGHNPPLVVQRNGQVERLEGGGAMLGPFPAGRYDEFEGRLDPDDLMAIYSDGVTEAINLSGDEFTEERLGALLVECRDKPAASIVHTLNQAVAIWGEGLAQADDLTVIVARRLRMES